MKMILNFQSAGILQTALTVALLHTFTTARAQPGSLDQTFVPQTSAYCSVQAIALQGDGKIVFCEQWPTYPPQMRVGRLNANGSSDPSFTPTFFTNEPVQVLVTDTNGQTILAGGFLTIQGQARPRIARLTLTGGVDSTFTPPSFNGDITALTLRRDGGVLIAGKFSLAGDVVRNGIARLKSDGTLDAAFDPGAGINNPTSQWIRAIAALPGDRILIAGDFSHFDGISRNRLALLKGDGLVEASFDPGAGPDGIVQAVAAQPDGRIVIGGEFTTVDGVVRRRIARLNADGTLDTSFNPAPGISVDMASSSTKSLAALALSADGRVYVGGSFGHANGVRRDGLARLLSDGTLDYEFDVCEGDFFPRGFGNVSALAVQPDGNVLVSGAFSSVNGITRDGLARVRSSGTNSAGRFEFSGAQLRTNEGAGAITFTVKRTGGSVGTVTVRYSTRDGTAHAPADYATQFATLTFVPGETQKTVSILIVNDAEAEDAGCCGGYLDVTTGKEIDEEVFSLQLEGAVLGGQNFALAVIEDDDTAFAFDAASHSVGELDGRATLPLRRLGQSDGTNAVTWTTAGGTATAGLDYLAGSNTVVFLPGETTKDIRLVILEDELTEGNETVEVRLSAPTGGAMLANPATTLLTIEDRPGAVVSTLPGAVDKSFLPGSWLDGTVYSLVVGNDGRILASGYFYLPGGDIRYLAWLHPDGSLDESFHPSPSLSGSAVAVQADGRALVATESLGSGRVVRLNADGSEDTTFGSTTYSGGSGQVLARQPDGRFILAGNFTTVDGVSRQWISRQYGEGGLDSSFDPGSGPGGGFNPGPGLYTVALQIDGKVFVGGDFTSWGGVPHSILVRLNSNGSLDPTFTPAIVGHINAIAIQNDGKVLVAGYQLSGNGAPASGIVRLTSEGSVDSTFVPSSTIEDGSITAMALQDDGKIVIGSSAYNPLRYRVARLSSDGSLDASFDSGTGPDDLVTVIALQSDGGVIVGGEFNNFNGRPRRGLVRLIGGDPPPSAPTIKRHPASLTVQEGANVTFSAVVSGFPLPTLQWTRNDQPVSGACTSTLDLVNLNLSNAGTYAIVASNTLGVATSSNAVLTILPATTQPGAVDLSFYPGKGFTVPMINFEAAVTALAVDGHGRALVAGNFSRIDGRLCGGIARLQLDGQVDPTFFLGTGVAGGNIGSISVQPDGKTLIAGWFFQVNGVSRATVARLHADGSVDESFAPAAGASYMIYATALQADGRILLAGDFSSFNGVPCGGIARLNQDGSLDPSFEIGHQNPPLRIFAMALQSDGRIVIGGDFTQINGAPRHNIARLEANGQLDATFTSTNGTDAAVFSVGLQTDGRIVVGGYFSAVNGIARKGIARLEANGDLDNSFTPGSGPDSFVRSLVVQNYNRILVAGPFTNFSGFSRIGLARLNSDGSVDPAFDVGAGPDGPVYALALQADGKILAGGSFTNMDNRPRSGIARLINSADSSAGQLEFTVPALTVPEAAGTNLVLLVRRVGGSHGSLLVNYGVSGGNARPGMDFMPLNGSLAFGDGDASEKSIELSVLNNLQAEGDRRLQVWLATPLGGATLGANAAAEATIVEDDTALEFAKTRIYCPESEGMLPVTVRRLGRLDGMVAVDYHTTQGTALAGIDYLPLHSTLVFAPGVSNQTVLLPLLDDHLAEPDLTVGLALTNATGNALLNTNPTALVTLLDNDRPGSLDTVFNPHLCNAYSWAVAIDIAVQRDGRPVVVLQVSGPWYTVDSLVRFLPNGSIDPGFAPPFVNYPDASLDIRKVVALPDDRILVAGTCSSGLGTGPSNFVFRLSRDGQRDPSFQSPRFPWVAADQVTSLLPLPNGQVVIGGSFQEINESARSHLARLNSDGSLDPTFQVADWASNSLLTVHGMALSADGKILLGGLFQSATNSNPYSFRLVRVNSDGTLDPGFNPDANLGGDSGYAYSVNLNAILFQPDSKIVVGGSFFSANGTARTNLARFNADGSLDAAFAPGFAAAGESGWNQVVGVALQPDGKLVVGGLFARVNGLPRNSLVRLVADGSVDTSFLASQDVADPAPQTIVYALALQLDGGILVGCDQYPLYDLAPGCGLVRISGTRTAAPRWINVASHPPGGKMILRFFAPPGTAHLVQACTNWNDWTTLGPASDRGGGAFEFQDSNAEQLPARFYRLLSLP